MSADDLYSPEPHADPDVLAAIRAHVMRSAAASAVASPAPGARPDRPSTQGPGRRRAGRRQTHSGARTNGGRRRVFGAVALSLGTAVAIFGFAASFTTGRSVPADASPLDQAVAALTGTTQAPSTSGSLGVADLPAGGYVYRLVETGDEVVTGGPGGSTLSYLEPETRQYWQRSDGSGVEQVHTLPAVFASTQDRLDAHIPQAPPDQEIPLAASNGVAPASYAYLATLPTQTVALRDRLNADSSVTLSPQRTFQLVVDLLDAGPPPTVQAALYRLAAAVPGVVKPSVGVTDELDREAHVLRLADDGRTYQLLFDPASGSYLGDQVVDSTGQVDSYRLIRTVSVAYAAPGATAPRTSPVSLGASTPADKVP